MEKLIYVAIAAVIILAILGGFFIGAVGNLFGFSFWWSAGSAAAVILAFGAGKIAGA